MSFTIKSTIVAVVALALTASAAPAPSCPPGTVPALSNYGAQSSPDNVCVIPGTCYFDPNANCAGFDGTFGCASDGWCCQGTDLTSAKNGNVCVDPAVGKANQEPPPSNKARAAAATCPPGSVAAKSDYSAQSSADDVCVTPGTCYPASGANCAGQDGVFSCAINGWCCQGTDLTSPKNGNVCVDATVGQANQQASSN
ncbi:alpha-galactosidase [Purpureocillium lavendulum]|uniref:Alpha-galactosidase n=1 Tax=Purpureocillium lavendulum TaxID=1247861 RepID=A0AB34FP96_9HYPO|nr:alpha-galactosidase [Purpureocillium lavendulum]